MSQSGRGTAVVDSGVAACLIYCCACADGQLLRGARRPNGQAGVWGQVEDTRSLLSPVQHHQHHCPHTSVRPAVGARPALLQQADHLAAAHW